MNNRQLSEHIGNIDDRLIKQAEQIPPRHNRSVYRFQNRNVCKNLQPVDFVHLR